MNQTRTRLRAAVAAFVVVTVGAAIVVGVELRPQSAAGDDPVTITTTTDDTAPPSTPSTVSQADVTAFLSAWSDADKAAAFEVFEAERVRLEAEAAAAAEAERRAAEEHAAEHAAAERAAAEAPAPAPAPAYTSGEGSGCVIPAYICQRESGFSYTALNPSSGAGGMYQLMPSTADAVARQIGRYDLVGVPPHLMAPADQDLLAATLWAGGAGCAHWSACG